MNRETLEKIRTHVYAAWRANPGVIKSLTQVADDIWITDRKIPTHTDPTSDGLVSYGLVLLNELGLKLLHRQPFEWADLSAGNTFLIDGRFPHAATNLGAVPAGLFAVLIWDLPLLEGPSMELFREEAYARVMEWLRETPKPYSPVEKEQLPIKGEQP